MGGHCKIYKIVFYKSIPVKNVYNVYVNTNVEILV